MDPDPDQQHCLKGQTVVLSGDCDKDLVLLASFMTSAKFNKVYLPTLAIGLRKGDSC